MNYPEPRRPAEQEHAVDALIRLIRARPGEYTLLTLGPLTNIAVALRRAPEIATMVRQCYVMGGAACTLGSVAPAAEYNIWVDPEAAGVASHSGMLILIVGWEHCRDAAAFDDAEMVRMRCLDRHMQRHLQAQLTSAPPRASLPPAAALRCPEGRGPPGRSPGAGNPAPRSVSDRNSALKADQSPTAGGEPGHDGDTDRGRKHPLLSLEAMARELQRPTILGHGAHDLVRDALGYHGLDLHRDAHLGSAKARQVGDDFLGDLARVCSDP